MDGILDGWMKKTEEEEEIQRWKKRTGGKCEENDDDDDDASEDMAVPPTPDDHGYKAEADTVGTITRVPYYVRPFSGTVYVGSGPSRHVFAPGPTGRDVNTLHRQWSFEVHWHLHPFRHYRERPYVAPTAPVAHLDRVDPDDPSPCPTRHPRHDDPYVMVRDVAARDEGDDAATISDP
ncbi:hypothetical protein Tco_0318885 [Tanacetum coccineum]